MTEYYFGLFSPYNIEKTNTNLYMPTNTFGLLHLELKKRNQATKVHQILAITHQNRFEYGSDKRTNLTFEYYNKDLNITINYQIFGRMIIFLSIVLLFLKSKYKCYHVFVNGFIIYVFVLF
eukprot:UN04851